MKTKIQFFLSEHKDFYRRGKNIELYGRGLNLLESLDIAGFDFKPVYDPAARKGSSSFRPSDIDLMREELIELQELPFPDKEKFLKIFNTYFPSFSNEMIENIINFILE